MQRRFFISLTICMSLSAHSYAADAIIVTEPTTQTDNVLAKNWIVQISPYMWATGLKGDISPFKRSPSIGIKKTFSDVLKDLEFAGFIDVWARYDRFVLSGDLMYVSTKDAENIGALPIVGPISGLSASIDSKQFNATLKAGYRVYETSDFSMDLLGGLRVWHISNDVTVKFQNRSVQYGEEFGWVDPLIGLRAFYNFTPELSVLAQADYGGFGVGSKNSWQGLMTLNYAFTKSFSASAGYKILNVDYADKGHVFDTTLKGPVIGMTYRF